MVIKVWSNPYRKYTERWGINDLGYSNVSGNTRFNESKLDEVRKVCDANQ